MGQRSWVLRGRYLYIEIEDVLAHTVEGTEDQPREQHGPKEGCMVYSQEPRSYVKTRYKMVSCGYH